MESFGHNFNSSFNGNRSLVSSRARFLYFYIVCIYIVPILCYMLKLSVFM